MTLSYEKAHQLAIERGLIPSSNEGLTKEKAYELAVKRGLIEPNDESFLDKTKKYAAKGARNIAAGIGDVIDLPFGLLDLGSSAIRSLTGRQLLPSSSPQIGEKIGRGIDVLTKDYTAPSSPGEKIAESVTRGLTTLPVGMGVAGALSKVPSLTKGAKALKMMSAPTASNIGTTAGATAASQAYLNENPNDALGSLLASLAGGVTGQKSLKALKNVKELGLSNTLANRTGKALQINPEKVAQMGDIPYSLGDVTNSPIYQALQNKASWAPGAGGIMKRFYKKQGDIVREKIGVDEFPLDEETAGHLIHKSAEKQTKAHSTKMEELKELYEKPIKEGNNLVEAPHSLSFNKEQLKQHLTPTEKSLYLKEAAAKEALNLERMAEEVAQLEKPGIKIGKENVDFQKHPHLKEMIENQINKELGEIKTNRVPYKGLQQIKSNIDDLISTYGQIGNVSQRALKELRGSIKNDLDKHFKSLGGETSRAWDTFNKEGSTFIRTKKKNFNEIFKANEKDLTKVFMDTIKDRKTNPRKLSVVYEGLSVPEREKLFGSFMHDLGKTGTNDFNIFKARRNFNDMRKAQQNVFLEGLSTDKARKDFRRVMSSLDLMNEKKLMANTSGTSHHEALDRYLTKIKELGKGIAGTAVGTAATGFNPVGLTLGLIAPASIAKGIFTNTKLLKWASEGMIKKNAHAMKRHLRKLEEMKDVPQLLLRSAQELMKSIE